MKFRSIFGYLSLTFAALSTTASAQNLQSVSNYSQAHEDLLASQSHILDQINVDEVQEFANKLYEDLEPESEVFSICWDSPHVDAYAGSGIAIPDKQDIDVSDYCMPCTSNVITSNYGYRRRFGRMHKGIDLRAHVGDTVRAAFDGKIRLTKYERRGYGYYVVIRHPNGLETIYGHLSRFIAKEGDIVKVGDPIALGGNTGRSTGAHLHFEVRFLGLDLNPNEIFDFKANKIRNDIFVFRSAPYRAGTETYYSNGVTYSVYRVRKGDTLTSIARKYRTSINALCRLNKISPKRTLRIGQPIRID